MKTNNSALDESSHLDKNSLEKAWNETFFNDTEQQVTSVDLSKAPHSAFFNNFLEKLGIK